ncbi:hypothetical protein ILUMI_10706 [Ignelater luminosus]|uniref:Small ribosomal subunit protein mS29 n=1 Tax=Ignelater luminosus TaxID=2038154 RepID=A0A8K0GDD6_IGNLU|nr:hypothetical protein ILUMI_10706 [Ignelater luminosus]
MLKMRSTDLIIRRVFSSLTSLRLQPFSTQPAIQERLETFRTTENSPLNHTEDHIGQFYRIPPETKKQLFLYGGLAKSYEIQTKTFTETCFMVRKPAVDIIYCMKTIDYSKPAIRFVMYGKKGNGKTLSLAHILHYALESKFLIVHVPWVGNWMRRCKESSNSEVKEGFIDLNIDAAAWLIHFKNQNAHLLGDPELKVAEDHVWNKRETTPKDAPLTELVEFGINRIKYASRCVVALAEEIKKLSKAGKCKTFVAVDGFNALFYPQTNILTEKKQVVHPSKVTLTEAFLNLTKFDWNNGVAVVIVDEIAIGEKDQISHLPRYLLGKEGFEHMDPFVPILVSEYTPKELKSCMDYYRERKWVQPLPGQDEELTFLSASNPYRLMLLCNPL